MHINIIGCEYVGKTCLAMNLMKWGKKHDINYHLDDHFTIPDSSMPTKDREAMLTLSPLIKERFQRFQAVYHVHVMNQNRDSLQVGFYSEDAIYGPLYYGYEPHYPAIRHGREIEKELPPDTILVLLTASVDVITKRMGADPHKYQVIKKKDIPVLLEKFSEEFQASAIRAKISIDTSDLTPIQVLDEFINEARSKYFTSEDLIRIMMNTRKP